MLLYHAKVIVAVRMPSPSHSKARAHLSHLDLSGDRLSSSLPTTNVRLSLDSHPMNKANACDNLNNSMVGCVSICVFNVKVLTLPSFKRISLLIHNSIILLYLLCFLLLGTDLCIFIYNNKKIKKGFFFIAVIFLQMGV